MIRDITIGQYFPVKSLIHKLDARMKIIITLAVIVIIFLCGNFWSLGLICAFITAAVLISRVPLKTVAKSVKPIAYIVVFTAALNVFYVSGGKMLFEYSFIKITEKGVYTAIFMAARIICLVVFSSLLTYTTQPTELTDALERLLRPLKVLRIDVHTVAMMMTLALRFIPTLIEETDRIMNAQKARGADWESGSLVSRAKALIPVLVPLFVSSFRRAYELAFAMECRCYQGGKGRTRMKIMKMKPGDFVAAGVIVVLAAAVVFFRFERFFVQVI